MWEQFGPGDRHRLGRALLGLAQHLTTGEVGPENSAEWLQTEEECRFMRLSADRWADAHIASGADVATARAADTTFAAYTGAAPAPADD